jgi:hypothetical protein
MLISGGSDSRLAVARGRSGPGGRGVRGQNSFVLMLVVVVLAAGLIVYLLDLHYYW